MDADGLIEELGYREAPGFLDEDRWHEAIEHTHVFRRTGAACGEPAVRGRFRGVYMLGVGRSTGRRASTPVVYVCEAPDQRAAEKIHRLTWNQSTAPFVIVHTPAGVRLYTGFDYKERADAAAPPSQCGVLETCVAFDDVAEKLDALRASHIDDGTVWARWGHRINPSRRVDVRLLENLDALGKWLHDNTRLERSVADALIGRFVYLRYLRDRDILTDARLRGWNVDTKEIFEGAIRLRSFHELFDKVDDWLNGSIFPLARSGRQAPKETQVQKVAGVMLGGEVDSGQLHLDFRAYDFSHIPIELLSSIYEQFMAREGRDREVGAYYTPIPLVNFVLGELDDIHPLQRGMRVLDPACGSGTFLVRCYQLLIEKRRIETSSDLSPQELRELLTTHIFGLDRDEEACHVTEFSLALALLDQIPTETLTDDFRLPDLHDQNIIVGDFFDSEEPWQKTVPGFDWIVGNPPWVKAQAKVAAHRTALDWMVANKKASPVCRSQIAEAFAWKAPTHLHPKRSGAVALVMPAMTLFEKQRSFRERFLTQMDVKAVANLANLREVLFRGRARLPAAVVFYGPRTTPATTDIAVYSPLVSNQEANRPASSGTRQTIWTITVDHSEVRHLSQDMVGTGDPLPWKTSMWGTARDLRLLRSVARRFPTLRELANERFHISEGLQLRDEAAEQEKPPERREQLEAISEVTGKPELIVSELRNTPQVHSFPQRALSIVTATRGHVRKGRGVVPLAVCREPHVVVSAARIFSVYCDEFLIVPPRQIGIAGTADDADLLRALALYLGSGFVRYHQFLTSPQMEFRGVATKASLEFLPIPFSHASAASLHPWVELHQELVALSDRRWVLDASDAPFPEEELEDVRDKMAALECEVDDLAAQALGLCDQDRWLVEDFVQVRLHLIDGKISVAAAGHPTDEQISEYAVALRDALDDDLDRGEQLRHAVTVVHHQRAGIVQIDFQLSATVHEPLIEAAHTAIGKSILAMRERIEGERGQWLYYNRNLVMYLDGKVFLCKPMQRIWWTRSQALADADQIVADLVAAGVPSDPESLPLPPSQGTVELTRGFMSWR